MRRRDFLNRIALEWRGKRISQRSASIAYFSLLSIAPLAIVVMILAPFIIGDGVFEYEVLVFLSQVFGDRSIPFFERIIANVSAVKNDIVYSLISVFLLFYGVGKLFLTLKTDLQEMFDQDISHVEGRAVERVVKERGHGLAFLGVLFVLGFIFTTFNVLLGTLTSSIAYTFGLSEFIIHMINTLVTLVVVGGLYASVYRVSSGSDVSWLHSFAGGVTASLLFLILNGAFAFYLVSSVFLSIFGGATFVLALLLWIYYGVHILFIGALVSKVYNQYV